MLKFSKESYRKMNKILFKYILSGYLVQLLKLVLIFYCFGLILNLFKKLNFLKTLMYQY